MNHEIFDLVKIKPFRTLLNVSEVRFAQKLHQYNINGTNQQFTIAEKIKIKTALLSLADIIKEEAEKIDTENTIVIERTKRPTRKLCRPAEAA